MTATCRATAEELDHDLNQQEAPSVDELLEKLFDDMDNPVMSLVAVQADDTMLDLMGNELDEEGELAAIIRLSAYDPIKAGNKLQALRKRFLRAYVEGNTDKVTDYFRE
jgi:hypothetical protein